MSFSWPTPHRACISLTFDNLGEAQDVLTGTWPPSKPFGTHPGITSTLPRMLVILQQHKIRATYFAESWSLPHYRETVHQKLVQQGHEVAWHGYQHEVWHSLSESEEEENFQKSWELAELEGVKYEGFRPPGGKINDRSWKLLRENGVKYVSPLGQFGIGKEGIVVLPFEWKAVDAFWYMDTKKFREIRKECGEEGEEGVGEHPEETFKGYLMKRIDEAVESGGYLSILFHPFLTTSEERLKVMEDVVKRISEDEKIWVAPCNEVAGWVERHKTMAQ
ncbi:peptidoglycan deacetylase [Cladorrhinum sp. PSN259]|nr:peptidoglycan deacetylase [Cladorrhinum sp. PSN259]